MKPKLINQSLITGSDDLKAMQDSLPQMIYDATSHFMKQKEDAIKERLAKRGFTFKHHLEYVDFVSTRCKVCKWTLSDDLEMLYVDGMPLFGWREEWITETEGFKYKLYFTE